jgi:predicted phosphodiesterase
MNINELNDRIIKLYDEGNNYREIARKLRKDSNIAELWKENTLRLHASDVVRTRVVDKEIITENVRLAKQKQRFQDLNRIERKSFREHARIENAIVELGEQLVKLLKKEGLKIKDIHLEQIESPYKLVLQFSDHHFNELIDLPNNKYDFRVAAQRLQKLANEIISIGQWKKTNVLCITFLGDLLNSDRRLDEKLSMATNRAKATSISVRLLRMFLDHLREHFIIYCAGVTGNESRSNQELGWSEILATDNYDFIIYDQLRVLYESKKGIEFAMMKPNEDVVSVNGKNFLLQHGTTFGQSNVQKKVQEQIGKYANKGRVIHYVLFGHIHSTMIADYFSRNASLAGSNAYSEESLHFVSKAAQNIHLVCENSDTIHSIKIDLQDVSKFKGYPIERDIDAYNAKSVRKTKQKRTVFEVII